MRPSHSLTQAAGNYFKVTLIRSPIGLPPKTRDAVRSLGLIKLHQTVSIPQTQAAVGHIFRVKELVKVRNVVLNEEQVLQENQRKKAALGFVKLGSCRATPGSLTVE